MGCGSGPAPHQREPGVVRRMLDPVLQALREVPLGCFGVLPLPAPDVAMKSRPRRSAPAVEAGIPGVSRGQSSFSEAGNGRCPASLDPVPCRGQQGRGESSVAVAPGMRCGQLQAPRGLWLRGRGVRTFSWLALGFAGMCIQRRPCRSPVRVIGAHMVRSDRLLHFIHGWSVRWMIARQRGVVEGRNAPGGHDDDTNATWSPSHGRKDHLLRLA